MGQANLAWPFVHAGDEAQQPVELDVAAVRTELLYLRPGRAARLVTDERRYAAYGQAWPSGN